MTAPRLSRGLLAAAAAVAWVSLALQLALMLDARAADGTTVPGVLWLFLGYYTILANIGAAVAGSLVALGRPVRPLWLFIVAATIAFVGLSYSLLLRWTWEPQGMQALVDHGFHDVVPLLFVAGWLTRAKPEVRWGQVPYAIAPPAIYSAYALLRGAADGWYAYWFFDPTRQSVPMMAAAFVGLAIVGLLVGAALKALDGRLRRGSV